jgi:hypothetical protein
MSAEKLFDGADSVQVRILTCIKDGEKMDVSDYGLQTFYPKDYGCGSIVSVGGMGIHHGGFGNAHPFYPITEENGVWSAKFCYEYRPVRDFGTPRDFYREITFVVEADTAE